MCAAPDWAAHIPVRGVQEESITPFAIENAQERTRAMAATRQSFAQAKIPCFDVHPLFSLTLYSLSLSLTSHGTVTCPIVGWVAVLDVVRGVISVRVLVIRRTPFFA